MPAKMDEAFTRLVTVLPPTPVEIGSVFRYWFARPDLAGDGAVESFCRLQFYGAIEFFGIVGRR